MFNLLIAIVNRQLSCVISRYALRAVDLKDMVVIDLWNACEQRPVETLIRQRVILSQPGAGPGIVRTEQRALKAGIPVFGQGLWHTGSRDPGCRLKRTGEPAVIWQDHWCDQPYRSAYPVYTCEEGRMGETICGRPPGAVVGAVRTVSLLLKYIFCRMGC